MRSTFYDLCSASQPNALTALFKGEHEVVVCCSAQAFAIRTTQHRDTSSRLDEPVPTNRKLICLVVIRQVA